MPHGVLLCVVLYNHPQRMSLPLSICSLNRLGGRKVAGGENEAKVKQAIPWLKLLVMLLPR